jgi:hypothetical protein
MDFGGEEGAEDLEKIRQEYQERLSEYRSGELARFTADLRDRLSRGEITEAVGRFEARRRMIDLLAEEDRHIDERSVEGVERNRLEKLKTTWRQFGKTRLVTGALLGGAAATGGTALIGASAAWGAVGTYTGVEAGLERYSKAIGHKSGLVSRISKENRLFVTEDGLDKYIFSLPEEEVRKEAARLRMLQVDKGVSIDNLKTFGDEGAIAEMIIRRDNQITAREALNNSDTAGQLSSRLAREVNLRNEAVESEVDRESWNKMWRKTIAALAGGTVGWLSGGRLFGKEDSVLPNTPHSPNILPDGLPPVQGPMPEHLVTSGENTWKIIESNLDSQKLMAGMGEAARTHTVDALKDMFDNLSPDQLRSLGFHSGDADIISIGDKLNFGGVLDNPQIISQALFTSNNLSPEVITSIMHNNATIANWFVAHHQELTGVFDSSVVEEVLKGLR